MAADLEQQFSISTAIEKGASGVFEVSLDGEPVFSKRALGRFPEPGEVEAIVKERLAGGSP